MSLILGAYLGCEFCESSLCCCCCVWLCLQYMLYSDSSTTVNMYLMETETPTVEDIQLLKKTVESEASQVRRSHCTLITTTVLQSVS